MFGQKGLWSYKCTMKSIVMSREQAFQRVVVVAAAEQSLVGDGVGARRFWVAVGGAVTGAGVGSGAGFGVLTSTVIVVGASVSKVRGDSGGTGEGFRVG